MSWEPMAPTGPRGISIGLEGPPGGGKTVSALLLAQGMQDVLGGPIIVIDTENRARKYYGVQIYDPEGRPVGRPLDFLVVPFDPPFRAFRFQEAIQAQIPRKPAAIIVDSISDEHDGEGGRLDWHEEFIDDILIDRNRNVPNYDPRARSQNPARLALSMEGWQPSSMARKKLAASINRIGSTPLILCFRAEEKTRPKAQEKNGRKINVPTNVGYQPIAPALFVHALDVVCLLPARADGVPRWRTERSDESFHLKLPQQFRHLFTEGRRITPEIGRALATWAQGEAEVKAAAAAPDEARPAEPQTTKKKSLTDFVRQVCDEEGLTGLRNLRQAWVEGGRSDRVDWLDERWDDFEERARAADAERAAAEAEPALPDLD